MSIRITMRAPMGVRVPPFLPCGHSVLRNPNIEKDYYEATQLDLPPNIINFISIKLEVEEELALLSGMSVG